MPPDGNKAATARVRRSTRRCPGKASPGAPVPYGVYDRGPRAPYVRPESSAAGPDPLPLRAPDRLVCQWVDVVRMVVDRFIRCSFFIPLCPALI
ncbi:hypothetical protein SSBG_03130 [Streptomyces sp. SPB074]|nr:hypothetical protein SSBG_03130 [Streptomyces sp. SPB074]